MLVPRYERHLLARCKRKQVVVAGIRRTHWRLSFGIGNDLPQLSEQLDESLGILGGDPGPQLRATEGPLRFGKERGTDDELELSFQPEADETSRRADPREKSRNQDIRVEEDPHALRAGFVLRLDSEPHRLVLLDVGGRPDPRHEIEAEVAAKRLLDHVAVAAAGSCSLDPNGAKDPLVERDGRSCLGHNGIIAS